MNWALGGWNVCSLLCYSEKEEDDVCIEILEQIGEEDAHDIRSTDQRPE